MWTSKLGQKYPYEWIQEQDGTMQKELKALRSLQGNGRCTDCGCKDNSWASVTHGVFICLPCSDVHRSVDTNVTKVKGCTGTYLWGPDEIAKMQTVGNSVADEVYGAKKISPDAPKEQKRQYVLNKYQCKTAADGENRVALTQSVSEPTAAAAVPAPVVKPSDCTAAVSVTSKKAKDVRPFQHVAVAAAAWCRPEAVATPARLTGRAEIPDSIFDDFNWDAVELAAREEPSKEALPQEQRGPACPAHEVDPLETLEACLNDARAATSGTEIAPKTCILDSARSDGHVHASFGASDDFFKLWGVEG